MSRKKKILLVEHWGACDKAGKPIGHTLKVIDEYAELLKDGFQVSGAMPQNMLLEVKKKNYESLHRLPYAICEHQPKHLWEKILDKQKVFANIREVRKWKEYDIIWYIRADFFLLCYLLFCPKRKGQKVYTLLYQNEYGTGVLGKVLHFIYKRAIQRFDGIIYTQKGMKIPHDHLFYMPDYLYRQEKYEKYKRETKEEKAVCLGTMNIDKDLEGLVDAFNENGFPLEIAGRFLDEERFERLKARAKSNIRLENGVLTYEEYYTRLGSAGYALLPYKMEAYTGRTSGVLQESMFLGTIPVAPAVLLSLNEIPGISYERIEQLGTANWTTEAKGQQEKMQKLLEQDYDGEKRKQELLQWMK